MYKSIRKHGINNFICEFLADGLDDEEVILIDKLKPEYNMTIGGDGGNTSTSPNYITGMERRDYRGDKNPMYGRRGQDNPNYGKRKSPDQIEKCRQNYTGKRIPVRVNGVDYTCVSGAAKALGRSERYVRIHDELNEWTY